MVISEIRSLYRDENNLHRTVIKRIYEQWNARLQIKIEFIYEIPILRRQRRKRRENAMKGTRPLDNDRDPPGIRMFHRHI